LQAEQILTGTPPGLTPPVAQAGTPSWEQSRKKNGWGK